MRDLSELKVGDKVLRTMSRWGRHMEMLTVEKVGKLHITVGGTKYGKFSGREAGHPYGSYYIAPFDQREWDDYLAEQREKQVRYELRDFDWLRCDKEIITKVAEIVKL